MCFSPVCSRIGSSSSSITMLKYPIPKDKRIRLAKIYFHVATTPGLSMNVIATCADAFKLLARSKKRISLEDMRLPWMPVYNILSEDLFLSRRQFEYSQLSWCREFKVPIVHVTSSCTRQRAISRRTRAVSSILPLSMTCFRHFSPR